MANIVYGNPFGAMVSGTQEGLEAVGKRQANYAAQRENTYNDWYQPLKQAQAQNGVAGELLKQAAAIAHYTGDYSNYNRILSHYLGVPPESLPPGYAQGKGGAQQTKAADLASGILPGAFAYPDIAGAGGAYRELPPRPAQASTGDPEIDALVRSARIAQLKALAEGATPPPVPPQMNPLAGITPTAQPIAHPAGPRQIQPVWGSDGAPPPEDFYGVPKPPKPAATSGFSPWADEYSGAPKQEDTDGSP